MAFGINRQELRQWQQQVLDGEIAFLTHYWQDERFPGCFTVTKVGCIDIDKLSKWGRQYELQIKWVHQRDKYPHFDLFGNKQKEILKKEGLVNHIQRFNL